MSVTTTRTNKPIIPRGQDASPLKYNRAALYSGKALDFDGVNDEIDLDGFTMSGNTASFAFYLKANEWNANDFIFDSRPTRLTIGGDGTNANQLQIRSGDIWVKLADISDTTNTNHFVITIDGTTAKLFLNGEPFGVTAILSSEIDLSSNANTALMSFSAGSGAFFNGQLSGFKIFNTALTAAQVADLYNNPEKIVPTGVADSALKLWLPMMEGAGTTAYDGSGNGNHGTISGATWTHGIGAPVAQTAVIDWNKGVNLTHYSEGFQWNTGGNTPTITQDQADPFGGTRAQRVTMDASGTFAQVYKVHNQINTGVEYTAKMWLKAVSGTPTIGINYNGSGGTWHQVTLTNEWAEYEVTRTMNADYGSSHNIIIGTPAPGTSSTADFYIYGLQIQLGDTAGPYVPTFGTAQTSDVLLPQGLTTGRDITGVNLFENVRKQGALNLDGNSWAEVHDNASLDFGTGSFTLEAWVRAKFVNTGSSNNTILSLGGSHTDANRVALAMSSLEEPLMWYNGNVSLGTNLIEGDWVHIVGTYDGTNITLYNDGSQVDQDARTAADMTNNLTKYIGRDISTNRLYQDQIAQPRIYNRALTATEVLQNYNSGKSIYTNS